jgi:hypothetical protein
VQPKPGYLSRARVEVNLSHGDVRSPERLMEPLMLIIQALHERHTGLTPAVAAYYLEAASVCLNRHHSPPKTFSIDSEAGSLTGSVTWAPQPKAVIVAWANNDDATRDGAYAVSLAAVEAHDGLIAIRRAENKTGADYFLVAQDAPEDDFENSYRLEVSGIDRGLSPEIRQRVAQKKQQTRRGQSNLPALVAVVGFRAAVIALERVNEE